MTRIESNITEVNRSALQVYTFLSDFNNFKSLMPEQVTDWSSTSDECSFTIKGMATLGMKIVEKVPYTLVKISSSGKVPFDFFLSCHLWEAEPGSKVQLAFDAELNPMMKMMATRPLTNFLNLLVEKLKEICQSESSFNTK